MMQYLTLANITIALAFVVGLDQALAQIPSIKANSTFQAVTNTIESIYSFVKGKLAPPAGG